VTPQRRFAFAAILTVVVVAYVVVPWVTDIIEGMATYSPLGYEPKDFARGERPRSDAAASTPETLLKVGLFLLLAAVWYLAANGGRPRR
jgi:hypothetical protein